MWFRLYAVNEEELGTGTKDQPQGIRKTDRRRQGTADGDEMKDERRPRWIEEIHLEPGPTGTVASRMGENERSWIEQDIHESEQAR